MGCKQTGLVTFRRSLSFVVAVQYTLPVVLHILQGDSYDKRSVVDKGTLCLWFVVHLSTASVYV